MIHKQTFHWHKLIIWKTIIFSFNTSTKTYSPCDLCGNDYPYHTMLQLRPGSSSGHEIRCFNLVDFSSYNEIIQSQSSCNNEVGSVIDKKCGKWLNENFRNFVRSFTNGRCPQLCSNLIGLLQVKIWEVPCSFCNLINPIDEFNPTLVISQFPQAL